jgi:hypothetical protein
MREHGAEAGAWCHACDATIDLWYDTPTIIDVPIDREALGAYVRQIWVALAYRRQPPAPPHHLIPWERLDEENKEIDRVIGELLFEAGRASCASEKKT